jgi:tetratricopeptide (TPR) repeat protein
MKRNRLRPARPAATRVRGTSAAIQEMLIVALRHHEAGRLEDARQSYLRILAVDVKHAWSLYGLGQIACCAGSLEVAEKMVRRAIAANDREPVYHAGLGSILQLMGKLEEAAEAYRRSLVLAPDDASIHSKLAGALLLLGRSGEAIAAYRQSLQLDPANAAVHHDFAVALRSCGRLDEAAAACHAAIALKPDFAQAHGNLALTLREQGNLEEAALEFERALALDPHSALAHANFGNLQLARGRRREARACYEQALALDPRSKFALWNRSLVDLLEGNYEAGWRDYELRCELPYRPPRSFPQTRWRGQPLNGARILLHAEQGLGDTLQFLRYVPWVQAAGGSVILDVPQRVRRLAECLTGLTAVTVDGVALPDFAYHCPLMSLPFVFATTRDSIPAAVPYLRVPEDARRAAASIPWPAARLRVGLVWSSGPAGPFRSLPLALLDPVLRLDSLHFFSLQLGPAAAELAQCRAPLTDLQDNMPDLADTGALMAQLDLLITVDTCTAHLAGALGIPAWVLLPFAADWRWLTDRDDTPWYPTLRLFRQPSPGAWQPVIETIARALALLRPSPARPAGL